MVCPAGPGCFVCPAGPGCFVCPWAAARPLAVRAASFARRVVSKPGQAPPPPTGTAADPSGALHTSGARSLMLLGASPRSPARPRHRPSISHVIPLRLVQTLNLHRWNCNVFGVSRKMSTINYVRNLGGGGVVAARGYRSLASPLPVGITGVSRVEFLGWSGVCCYKRRQSKVFFVWISVPLLQTSSI